MLKWWLWSQYFKKGQRITQYLVSSCQFFSSLSDYVRHFFRVKVIFIFRFEFSLSSRTYCFLMWLKVYFQASSTFLEFSLESTFLAFCFWAFKFSAFLTNFWASCLFGYQIFNTFKQLCAFCLLKFQFFNTFRASFLLKFQDFRHF